MAVLWMDLAPRNEARNEARPAESLARALTGRGLELLTWLEGEDPPDGLPEDLRGIEAVVVVGGRGGNESGGGRPSRVDELLEAARAAELPILRPGDGRGDDGRGDHDQLAERVAEGRYHARTRAFFTPRALGWEKRFPDDGPVYREAVAHLRLGSGAAALDAGCGTGRALPLLRAAVGPAGTVLGTDLTPAMLREAARLGRGASGALAVADCLRLPLRDGTLDGVFAAGLLPHVPAPLDALRELARVVADGGRLALFHPVGRAVLAERHGRTCGPDDLLAEPNLRPALGGTGWRLDRYQDAADRFLAVAVREKRSIS